MNRWNSSVLRGGLGFLTWLFISAVISAAHADSPDIDRPLAVRLTFPVTQLYGLPRIQGAKVASTAGELNVRLEHSSSFTSDYGNSTVAFFDGETSVLSVAFRRPLRESWEWGVEVPYVRHSGGFLDDFLDDVHDILGKGDGGRALAKRDKIDYMLRVDGEMFVDFQTGRQAFGDPKGWLGYAVLDTPERSLSLRGSIKLPVGEVDSLSGSEAVDVSLWTEFAQRGLFGQPQLTLSAMAGMVLLGEGELAPTKQEQTAFMGHLGVQYRISPSVALIAQLDGHTRLLDAELDQIGGQALQGTLGGRIRVSPRYWLDVGIVEDLRSQSTSDVVFNLALGTRL